MDSHHTRNSGTESYAQIAADPYAIRLAMSNNQLRLYYQPLVDLQSGKICAMEALPKWVHPGYGEISTLPLMQIAEASGATIDVGEWVMHQVCADIRTWLDQGMSGFCIAINISSRQIEDPLLGGRIVQALAERQIPPRMLSLEFTETVLMQDSASSVSVLQKFKDLGVELVLDNFGTGFSSLNYLKCFPFDKVKIDQSFVNDFVTNVSDAAMSKAIISMAHSFGIKVVAEGVESEAQCAFLSQNMCDEIQGSFFSEALESAQIDDIFRQGRPLPNHLLRFYKPRQTLLLVDDENNIIGALKRLLRGCNFTILTANGGQAGLDILAEHPVDVIVSDQRMPGMTGVEFLGIAKGRYPDTVRIVLSGYTELHSVTDAVNEGAIYKFLTKPWDDVQLKEHIEEAFRRKEMADDIRRLNLEIRTANQELAAANKKLEELLQQKQQQIVRDEISLDIVRETMQQIPLALIGIDNDETVVFANDAAQLLFDDAPSILGGDVNQLIPELLTAEEFALGKRCVVKLSACFYEVISRRMGHGSRSQGKIMTLTPYGGAS